LFECEISVDKVSFHELGANREEFVHLMFVAIKRIKMNIYKEIKEYISFGEIEIAFDKIKSIAGLHPSIEKEIIVMLSRFHRNKKEYELGVLDPDKYERRNNMVSMCFVSIVQKIEGLNEMEKKINSKYEEGITELTWRHHTLAIEKFGQIEKSDDNYLKSLLNSAIAEYSIATTEKEILNVLKYFLEIEISTVKSDNPNIDLLKKTLFNRITILNGLGLNKLALNDIEKIKIIDPSWAEYFLNSSSNV
jgi:hypothetical protein